MTEPAKEKMAPVQGFVGGIPWSLHLEAYNAYCKKWSPQPALIDLEGRNCRGGFGTGELDEFIPGWRDKVSEIGILKAELAGLRAKVAQQAALVEKCMAAMNENADRGEKAEAKLAALEPFDDWPDYHSEAMGCGLEDRNITDRYEAMQYGWDQALDRVAERLEGYAAAGAAPVPEDWRSAVAMAYGHLWHVNNEPMAPIPLRSEESASYAARKLLRDLLTTEERGEAINSVRAMLSSAPKDAP